MFVKQFKTGGDRNFAYLAADETSKNALLIDPSYSPEMLADFAQQHGYKILYIFNTHKHYDHTNGNPVIFQRTGIKPVSYGDTEPHSEQIIRDGVEFQLGALQVKILHTPGHTPDSICILVNGAVFTGDTLFVGKVGGTDFEQQARQEYDSLHQKLLTLPDDTRVYPGHDYGVMPESSIGYERKTNPFLLQPDQASFINLKKNWAAYKKEHGIS
ncbi:MAG TPA: hydroxyacylglutathione hydrolase family protein [bacterium]|nr:hydroxyacylglutathione hydrolase family protein [bacterium]HPN44151.1 hydroxyacylglutathione hydrolase family protein [bacterium]